MLPKRDNKFASIEQKGEQPGKPAPALSLHPCFLDLQRVACVPKQFRALHCLLTCNVVNCLLSIRSFCIYSHQNNAHEVLPSFSQSHRRTSNCTQPGWCSHLRLCSKTASIGIRVRKSAHGSRREGVVGIPGGACAKGTVETPERVRVRDLLLQTEARLAGFRAELSSTHDSASLTATPSKGHVQSSGDGHLPAAPGHAQLARALFHGAPASMDDAPAPSRLAAPHLHAFPAGHGCQEGPMSLSRINTRRLSISSEEEDCEVGAHPHPGEASCMFSCIKRV